jgi:membrane-associated phospholipid phosphatase
MLLVLFFWKSVGRWRWLLALYPVAMGFTLVYTAEHFVIDILLGWLYAVLVFIFGNWLFDRYEARRLLKSGDSTDSTQSGAVGALA